MAAGDSVSAALASAKKTLQSVSHSNVDTGGHHAWTPPSYAAAKASRKPAAEAPTEGMQKEAADVAQGLKNRRENVDQYVDAQKQQ